MKCPVCITVDLLMSDKQGVEVDYCPQCRGIWLDRGELDKIIERANAQSTTPSYPPNNARENYKKYEEKSHHGNYSHDSHNGYHKKKKSFLGEIFDF